VLIVAKGKRECETLADITRDYLETNGRLRELTSQELGSALVQRLDSRLEREMYADVPLRKLVRYRIAYHHAGLPPRVRVAVEEAIRAGLVDLVYATTTLAEGVNFPFASVLIQSLALRTPPAEGRPSRYEPVTPRTFWNIAGRAGRPGFDTEGQVILFTPSLGLERIEGSLQDYINAEQRSVDPVRSALALGLEEIVKGVRERRISLDAISSVRIAHQLPKDVVSTINLLRVGLVHGRASQLIEQPADLLRNTFASASLDEEDLRVAGEVIALQDNVVQAFIGEEGAPPIQLVAELGLSLETLTELRDYVRSREDWQLEAMGEVMRGGVLNQQQVEYVVRPTASRMAELGGTRLGGGILGNVVVQWLLGLPFTAIRARANGTAGRQRRLEDLISLVYTRVQYLLPWGLYAMDRLVAEETRRRGISYDHQIQSVAYLADAGVPDLDALRLVAAELERGDATRLSTEYRRRRLRSRGVDILSWISSEPLDSLIRIVRGPDNRRVDYDLPSLVQAFQSREV
jgi:hypothetical protein